MSSQATPQTQMITLHPKKQIRDGLRPIKVDVNALHNGAL